jgi:hypothetical protein
MNQSAGDRLFQAALIGPAGTLGVAHQAKATRQVVRKVGGFWHSHVPTGTSRRSGRWFGRALKPEGRRS